MTSSLLGGIQTPPLPLVIMSWLNDVITFGGYPDPPPPPQVMTSFMNSPLSNRIFCFWMYRFSCWCVLVSTLPDLLIRIKSTKKTQLILIFFIAQCTITLLNSLPLSGHSAPAVSGLSLNLLSKGVKLSRGQRGSCCRRMELCRQHAWGPGGENHLQKLQEWF